MNPELVKFLRCPKTGEKLELSVGELFDDNTVKTGKLSVQKSGINYPIVNGIPRFVGKEGYSSSFGYEWKKWPKIQFESENIGKPMEGRTRKIFESTTGLTKEKLTGKTVVDFGCGSGRFMDIVRKNKGIIIGIDMSSAVDSAREYFKGDKNVLVVQGDLLAPPFGENVFDFGFTIGVLHHTPNPSDGLKKLTKSVKPGGEIACNVYQKKSFYDYPSVYIARIFNNALADLLGDRFSRKIALGYAYFDAYFLYYVLETVRKFPFLGGKFAKFIEMYFLVNVPIPDVRWRILDTFDAITPKIASTHTPEEVRGWFESAGLKNIRQTRGNNSFVGIKT